MVDATVGLFRNEIARQSGRGPRPAPRHNASLQHGNDLVGYDLVHVHFVSPVPKKGNFSVVPLTQDEGDEKFGDSGLLVSAAGGRTCQSAAALKGWRGVLAERTLWNRGRDLGIRIGV